MMNQDERRAIARVMHGIENRVSDLMLSEPLVVIKWSYRSNPNGSYSVEMTVSPKEVARCAST